MVGVQDEGRALGLDHEVLALDFSLATRARLIPILILHIRILIYDYLALHQIVWDRLGREPTLPDITISVAALPVLDVAAEYVRHLLHYCVREAGRIFGVVTAHRIVSWNIRT